MFMESAREFEYERFFENSYEQFSSSKKVSERGESPEDGQQETLKEDQNDSFDSLQELMISDYY